ncbi:MAG: peptidoglycan endopeptidase [Verrucomicrobium sp.]
MALLLASCSSSSAPKSYEYKFVPGKSAIMRGNVAFIPTSAPEAVKRAIGAGNRLQGKPYIYGGGHRRIEDVGYDCSGTLSYVLYHAGLLKGTMASDEFRSYGKPGEGKWITIYAKKGHVFCTIGGLRLDTGYHGQNEGPRWSMKPRPAKGCMVRHPPGL